MWFNEDDDFEDNEAVVPAGGDLLTKKIEPSLDNIGKIMEKKTEPNGPKPNNTLPKQGVLNNNASAGSPPSTTIQDGKSSVLFKKVHTLIVYTVFKICC